MRVKTNAPFILMVAFIIAGFALAGQPTFASESDEESPGETAQDLEKEAISKYNSGIKHMKKARLIVQVGDSAFAYNYRATSDAKARKELDKAIKDFKQAVSLKPKFAKAYNNLGYCYRKIGDFKQSLTAYEFAIGIDSNFAQAREYRGETYLALGNLSGADSELTYLTKMKSSYADTLAHSIMLYKLARINKKSPAGDSQ